MNFARATFFAIAALAVLPACDDSSKKVPAAAVQSATPAAAPTAAPAAAETLTFSNENSKLGFVGSKVTANHEGTFEKFHGTIRLSGARPEASSVEVEIETDSLKTEPEKLQGHLKSPDLLDTAQFPKASFKSTEIKPSNANGATDLVTGNLILHGAQKSITFPATIQVTESQVSAKAEFSIKRKDFGIVYPGMPNDLISDNVVIKFDIHAPRNQVAPAKDTPHP